MKPENIKFLLALAEWLEVRIGKTIEIPSGISNTVRDLRTVVAEYTDVYVPDSTPPTSEKDWAELEKWYVEIGSKENLPVGMGGGGF